MYTTSTSTKHVPTLPDQQHLSLSAIRNYNRNVKVILQQSPSPEHHIVVTEHTSYPSPLPLPFLTPDKRHRPILTFIEDDDTDPHPDYRLSDDNDDTYPFFDRSILEQLQVENKALVKQFHRAQQDHKDEQVKQMNTIQAKNAEIEELYDTIQGLQRDRVHIGSEYDRMSVEYKRLNQDLALRGNFSRESSPDKDWESNRSALENDLEQTSEALRKAESRLEVEIDEKRLAFVKLEQLEKLSHHPSSAIQDIQQRLDATMLELQRNTQEKQRLQDQLDAALQDARRNAQDKQRLQEQLDAALKELQDFRHNNQDKRLQEQLEAALQDARRSTQEKQRIQEELDHSLQDAKRITQDKQRLQDQLDTTLLELQDTKRTVQNKQRLQDQLDAQNKQRVQEQLDSSLVELQDAKRNIQDRQKIQEQLETVMTELHEARRQNLQDAQKLQDQQRLQEQLDKALSELQQVHLKTKEDSQMVLQKSTEQLQFDSTLVQERLQKQLDVTLVELHEARRSLQEKQGLQEQLEIALQAAKRNAQEKQRIQEELDVSLQDAKRNAQEKQRLQDQLEPTMNDLQNARHHAQKLQDQLDSVVSELQDARRKEQRLQNQLDTSISDVQEFENNSQRLQEQAETALTELHEARKQKLEDTHHRLQDQQRMQDQLDDALLELQESRRKKQSQNVNTQERRQESIVVQIKHEYDIRISDLISRNDKLQRENNNNKQELIQLGILAQNMTLHFNALSNEHAMLVEQIDQTEHLMEQHCRQLQNEKQFIDNNQLIEGQFMNKQLLEDVERYKQQLVMCDRVRLAAQQALEALEREYIEFGQQRSQLEQQLQQVTQERNELKENIVHKKEITRISNELRKVNQSKRVLEQELLSSQQQSLQSSETCALLRLQLESAEKKLEQLHRRYDAAIKDKRVATDTYTSQIHALHGEYYNRYRKDI
jgi:chromosome segregation ATPase